MIDRKGTQVDIIIIGAGPAGYSAAITLAMRGKKALLFGGEAFSSKVMKAHEIANYPGLSRITGEAFGNAILAQARDLGIEAVGDRVTSVYAMGDYYALQTASGRSFETTALILATGVNFEKTLPGEEAFLGRGVSYCATCDGMLYRGKRVAVIAYSEKEEEEVSFLAQQAQQLFYIPMYQGETAVISATVEIVKDKPISIEGELKATRLILANRTLDVDGVFVLRDRIAPSQLVPGLITEDGHITVNRKMETNLPGCFACGDVTGTPYQNAKAVGEGNVAALSAVAYLNVKK